ncbi:MAG: carboxypeptidase regulatory-like domain-containing protein [Planctomycetes bacterium]|nr:carboxypeptidase regulatory-like domain-containing protein [Planctomycetota bacterium]
MNGNFRRSRARCCWVAVFAALAGGCGGPETATVSGRVTFRGKPVTSGSVIVYCSDKQIVRGNIGSDGTYTIPNVPRGALAVTVQSHARVPAGMRLQQNLPPATGGPIPPTVSADDPACVALPPRYAVPEESGLSVQVERGLVTFDIDLKP